MFILQLFQNLLLQTLLKDVTKIRGINAELFIFTLITLVALTDFVRKFVVQYSTNYTDLINDHDIYNFRHKQNNTAVAFLVKIQQIFSSQ